MSEAGEPRGLRTGVPAGGPRVSATDDQSAVAVDVAHLEAVAGGVLHAEGVVATCELALLFVDEKTMAELNERFLDGTGPTDVVAFPMDAVADSPPGEGPSDVPLMLGDVVVCPAVAQRNAAAGGGRTDDELALLVVHGVLHVLGMDHAEPEEARAMQARERDLLARLHASR